MTILFGFDVMLEIIIEKFQTAYAYSLGGLVSFFTDLPHLACDEVWKSHYFIALLVY